MLEQGSWIYHQTLRAPLVNGINCSNTFGEDFSFDGERIGAGSISQIPLGADRSGMAYIFVKDASNYFSLEQIIPAPLNGTTNTNGALFGRNVEIDGDRMYVTIGGYPGGVLLYERVGGVWNKTHEFLEPLIGTQDWGYTVAVDGGRVAIGSRRGSGIFPSAQDFVRIFTEQPSGGWAFEQDLWISGPGMDPGDYPNFGRSMDLDGDWLVIGSPGVEPVPAIPGMSNAGRVFVYHRDAVNGWSLFSDFANSDNEQSSLNAGTRGKFGSSVSMDLKNGQIVANAPLYLELIPSGIETEVRGGIYVFDLELGDVFCDQSMSNSAGMESALSLTGSQSIADGNLTLHAHHLPPGTTALFLFGQEAPGWDVLTGGTLCIGGPLGVGRIAASAPGLESGEAFHRLNFTDGWLARYLVAGTTWGFQVWHREPGTATHFTHAVRLTLEP